mgnify:FL=1
MNWKIIIVFSLLYLCFILPSFAQQDNSLLPTLEEDRPPTIEELMNYDERLKYRIKYSFFTVGWVDVFISRDSLIDGRKAWLLRSRVIANSSIPFVKKDTTLFSSWMVENDTAFYSHKFWYDDVDDKVYKSDEYIFDRQAQKVYLKHKEQPTDTLKLHEPASSGHIMYYFTRLFAGTTQHFEAPIYVDEGLGKIIMDFTTQNDRREYEAFEHKITTYIARGTSTITGPFGLNGDFEAWFATDRLRIPVETHLNVFLGNVKVQLIEYSRTVRKDS